jgi:hypothetical protein
MFGEIDPHRVMAVLVTAIHVFGAGKDADAPDQIAHDGVIRYDRNMLQSAF